jgi:hypothetical protein
MVVRRWSGAGLVVARRWPDADLMVVRQFEKDKLKLRK